jgi:hypothetical protein
MHEAARRFLRGESDLVQFVRITGRGGWTNFRA